jgi:hypothetical protein
MTDQRGVALIMVILVTSFLSALGLGAILAVFMDRLATGNISGSVALLYAADAGIELAARELARQTDWDAVLAGAATSTFTDGVAGGVRDTPGGETIDLSAATNMLNCGVPTNCTVAQMDATSRDRPWGANNPRWQLFAFGPLPRFAALLRPSPCYLVVWIADDGRESDGNPFSDAAEGDEPGHGIVRIHAEAYGVGGSRRAIEAELVRVCPAESESGCLPGIRVQSWQELREAIP